MLESMHEYVAKKLYSTWKSVLGIVISGHGFRALPIQQMLLIEITLHDARSPVGVTKAARTPLLHPGVS